MRFCYADPPYPGQAKRHYGCEEIDHAGLIARLCIWFPDGWALSTGNDRGNLRRILNMCPEDVRVMAWVKPWCSFKPGVGVAYAWEPVIVRGGRKRTREQLTMRDWVAANITMGRPVHGAKPDAFCAWLFEIINVQPGDEFVDLFPGSGAVSRALQSHLAQRRLLA